MKKFQTRELTSILIQILVALLALMTVRPVLIDSLNTSTVDKENGLCLSYVEFLRLLKK